MGGKQPSLPKRFFKVMMPGFHQKLNLPLIVSKEVEKHKSRRAIVVSRRGRWRVSLCRNRESGLICLNQGWPQFVDRHALTMGEFVFFEHTGDLHFHVSVFGADLCEREFLEEQTQTLIPTQNSTIEEDENTYFEKTMGPQHGSKFAKLTIPIRFMRWNNLGKQHRSVVLRDPNGREWPVKLTAEYNGVFCHRMTRGWFDFYASNDLKEGDSCVFHLNRRLLKPTTVFLDVHIVRGDLGISS